MWLTLWSLGTSNAIVAGALYGLMDRLIGLGSLYLSLHSELQAQGKNPLPQIIKFINDGSIFQIDWIKFIHSKIISNVTL